MYIDQMYWCCQPGKISYASVAPCALLVTSAVCRSGSKLRYYKPHYQSILKRLWKAALYTYLECWRQLCWTVWSKINIVTMKSFFLRALGSLCQQRFWKISLEPRYCPKKDNKKKVFLTQTHSCLQRRVGFRLPDLKLSHDPLVLK